MQIRHLKNLLEPCLNVPEKTIGQENLMKFVTLSIVSAIFFGHLLTKGLTFDWFTLGLLC